LLLPTGAGDRRDDAEHGSIERDAVLPALDKPSIGEARVESASRLRLVEHAQPEDGFRDVSSKSQHSRQIEQQIEPELLGRVEWWRSRVERDHRSGRKLTRASTGRKYAWRERE
jgi:hypothetical protein